MRQFVLDLVSTHFSQRGLPARGLSLEPTRFSACPAGWWETVAVAAGGSLMVALTLGAAFLAG